MANHILRILGPEGHIQHEWDTPQDPRAEKAEEAFNERIPTYQAVADGVPTRTFSREARETTMFPQMQAG